MNKIKAPKKSSWAYVCFRNEDDKNRAIEVLNGYEWKGKKISASVRFHFNHSNYIITAIQ